MAYQYADVIIVDVNLDVQKASDENKALIEFDVDQGFKKAITSIAENCKEDILILIETTVPPGTCEKVVKPIIEKHFENRGMDSGGFKLGHSYERVMPGPNYIDSYRVSRVYSGINEEALILLNDSLKL